MQVVEEPHVAATLRLGLIPLFGVGVAELVVYETLVVAATMFHHAIISLGRFDRLVLWPLRGRSLCRLGAVGGAGRTLRHTRCPHHGAPLCLGRMHALRLQRHQRAAIRRPQ